MNRKGIDYSVLEREVQSSKQLYESLMQRAKETGISERAQEQQHPGHRPRRAAARADRAAQGAEHAARRCFGGTVLAFGLAFFFEYLDSRIKTPDEIKAHLGLPSLGMVPALDAEVGKGKEPLIHAGVPPSFAEAFRTIRTNVLFSSADEGSRTLVVTSTGPGEGKTTVASNLAIGFAQAGQRVLLIDADMRRPRVHEVFGHEAGAGTLEPDGRQRQASEACTRRRPGAVGAGRRPHPAEPGGAARLAAVP